MHIIRKTCLTVATILVTATSINFAHAQGTEAQRTACMPDAFRLCSSEIPNVSRIVACMEKKKSELSPACRAQFKPQVAQK